MNKTKQISKLQLITHPTADFPVIEQVRRALEGGCNWVQLRMKNHSSSQIITEAKKIAALKNERNFTLIINDHPEIVRETGADGVHLGKSDMRPSEARKIVGHNRIIGGTANTISDIEKLVDEGIDYIGLGPFRFTSTKENLSPVLGIEGYEQIMNFLHRKRIKVPVVGIGGILPDDVAALLAKGLYGIAVSTAITQAESVAVATQLFIQNIEKQKIPQYEVLENRR